METLINNKTQIDTIGIQIDCNNPNEQNDRLDSLISFVVLIPSLYYRFKDTLNEYGMILYRTHFIYCSGTILATITTGSFQILMNQHYKTNYYIKILFAGLKSYNEIQDNCSYEGLMRVCAFLNGTKQEIRRGGRIPFKMKELDCCIDINCNFENVWGICVKRAGKTKYYNTDDTQTYYSTTYIEKIAPNKLSKAIQRAYTYDKQHKENLIEPISRFEVKLQSNYFINHGFKIEYIKKALNRYYFMYFENLKIKQQKIEGYRSIEALEHYEKLKPKTKQKTIIRSREIKKLELAPYRLHFDTDYINKFIDDMYSITIDDLEWWFDS